MMEKRLTCVIVEDERHSRETLNSMLNDFIKGVEVLAMATNVEEGVRIIRENNPDIIFLDIELQTGTGFDILEQLKDMEFDVIFTTAFEQYAIKAIKFSSLDYLLKPIDIDELQSAIDKVKKKVSKGDIGSQMDLLLKNLKNVDKPERICLSTAEGFEFISTKDIILCEASGSYTNFILAGGKSLLVSKHLKEYENMLTGMNFMRVHNSYLINLDQVKKFVKSEGGYILMNNGSQVSISPKKRDEFILRMSS